MNKNIIKITNESVVESAIAGKPPVVVRVSVGTDGSNVGFPYVKLLPSDGSCKVLVIAEV